MNIFSTTVHSAQETEHLSKCVRYIQIPPTRLCRRPQYYIVPWEPKGQRGRSPSSFTFWQDWMQKLLLKKASDYYAPLQIFRPSYGPVKYAASSLDTAWVTLDVFFSFCYIVGALYCIPEHSVVCIHTKMVCIHPKIHMFIRYFICVDMFSFVFDHKLVFRRSKESREISLNQTD